MHEVQRNRNEMQGSRNEMQEEGMNFFFGNKWRISIERKRILDQETMSSAGILIVFSFFFKNEASNQTKEKMNFQVH